MLALALAGCGSTGSTTTSEKPAISFSSPAVVPGKPIPARYKCNVRNSWLPLRWGALPAGTQELALYIVRFGTPKVVKGGRVKAEIQAESIVVGLKPTLRRLSTGKFPPGAVVGVRPVKDGQTICPTTTSRSRVQNLLFRIFALPHKLDLGKGKQPSTLVSRLDAQALEAGTFIAEYRQT
jgi:phosphatidylethanolamine-binding protein (PEBP) family uncharacterized protein